MKKADKISIINKKPKYIKINNSASAKFDIIALPYYLLWFLPEHVDDISKEYYTYLKDNLDYILTGK